MFREENPSLHLCVRAPSLPYLLPVACVRSFVPKAVVCWCCFVFDDSSQRDIFIKLTSTKHLAGAMETRSDQKADIVRFFKEKGMEEENIHKMFRRCNRLERAESIRVSENWNYLKSIGIQERKLPHIVSKCPKILTLGLSEKLVPTVHCLATLGTKPGEVALAIAKFPHILSHSVEEKLCPLLAFFEALGIPEKQMGKLVLLNPRLISYSIETKFSEIVDFLASLGLDKGMIGKVLVKNPFIMGYSVERRLRTTVEFLKSVGLNKMDLQRVVFNFPEVLCRDVDKILKPNLAFLKRCGLNNDQIVVLVTGYPPVLIKSIKNSLEPRIKYLVEGMGRGIGEVAEYPEFFRHRLKKSLEIRQKLLEEKNLNCSLSEMLDCNQKKFFLKFGH